MNGLLQKLILPFLQKLMGQHLEKKWIAVASTAVMMILAVLSNLGILMPDQADWWSGMAAAVLGMNVIVTTNTKKKEKKVGQ